MRAELANLVSRRRAGMIVVVKLEEKKESKLQFFVGCKLVQTQS